MWVARKTRSFVTWHVPCIVVAALIPASCCTSADSASARSPRSASTAMLAAARQHGISLFGDVSGTPAPAYISRTGLTLRQHSFTEVGGDFDPAVSPEGFHVAFASTRHHAQPDLYVKAVEGVSVMQLTSDASADIQPAFSPDGSRVAFASDRSGNWDIWVVGLDGGPAAQITNSPAEDIHPSWSPDGRQLVYCSLSPDKRQWELWIADVSHGASRRLIGYGLFPQWSPAGDAIVYQRARERGGRWFSIWRMTFVDGEPRYPTELAASANQAMIMPAFSADGGRVAYVTVPLSDTGRVAGGFAPTAASGPYDVWVMNADGSGKVRLTDGLTVNHGPAFAPDGRIFFTCNRTGFENIWSMLPGSMDGLISMESAVPALSALARDGNDSRAQASYPAGPDDL